MISDVFRDAVCEMRSCLDAQPDVYEKHKNKIEALCVEMLSLCDELNNPLNQELDSSSLWNEVQSSVCKSLFAL